MTDPRSPLGPGGSHPEEALAAFTDGTATPDERAAVLQHLQDCDRCRREVGLARGALAALSSLPEPGSPGFDPADIARRAGNVTAIDQGRRPAERRRRVGAIAGGLVAAAVVAAAFAGIVKLNGNNAATSAGGAMAPSPNAPEAAPSRSLDAVFGPLNRNFTPASIDRLAAAVAANTGTGESPGASPGKGAADREASAASTCADQASEGGHVVRILVAAFQGHPAYVVVLRGDDGGQDVIRVVVTDRTNCAILYTASHPVTG
jgi:anti-sigma factor RsiW